MSIATLLSQHHHVTAVDIIPEKEEFIRQRDAYRVQEDERMEQIQRLRTEKDQIFLPVRKDADNLQTVVSAAEEAGDVMHLSQNVVETFIDRIEVFNDERVKIRFTFEDACTVAVVSLYCNRENHTSAG